MAEEGGTIKARMTLDTKGIGTGAEDAKRQVTALSKTIADLFGREPVGERRFRGVITGTIRDLAGMQSGATGAAQAVATLFERLSLGTGIGAVLAGIGAGMVALVRHGEELRKESSEAAKEMQHLGREAKLATEAHGFDALAATAQRYHKAQRHARDEAAKDVEHHERRKQSILARTLAVHPSEILHPARARVYLDEKMAENRKRAAEAQEGENKLSAVAVRAAQEQAQLAQSQLTGTKEDVELHRLRLETMQREVAIQQSVLSEPQKEAALGALRKEIELRKELIHVHQQQEDLAIKGEREQAQMRIAGASLDERRAQLQASALTQQQKQLALAHESVEAAKQEQAAAEERVRQASEELELSKNLSQEDEERARAKLEEAQAGAMRARAGVIGAGAAAGEAAAGVLEKEGAEEEMTPEQKWKQYWERIKKMEGLRRAAARRGIRADEISGPQWGEAEYDPLARYRSDVAGQEAGGTGGIAPAAQAPIQLLQGSNRYLQSIDSTAKEIRDKMVAPQGTKPEGTQPPTPTSPGGVGGTTAPPAKPAGGQQPPAGGGQPPTQAPTEPAAPTARPGQRTGVSRVYNIPVGQTLAEHLKSQQLQETGAGGARTVAEWRQNIAKATREGQLRGAGVTDEKGNIDEKRAGQIANQFGVQADNPNLDWRFMSQSMKNQEAYSGYWNDPQVQKAREEDAASQKESRTPGTIFTRDAQGRQIDWATGKPAPRRDIDIMPTAPRAPPPSAEDWRKRAFPGHPAEDAQRKQTKRDDALLHLPGWSKPMFNELTSLTTQQQPQQPQPQAQPQVQPQPQAQAQPPAPEGGGGPITSAQMEQIMAKYWS
jgi:hypothetical protein